MTHYNQHKSSNDTSSAYLKKTQELSQQITSIQQLILAEINAFSIKVLSNIEQSTEISALYDKVLSNIANEHEIKESDYQKILQIIHKLESFLQNKQHIQKLIYQLIPEDKKNLLSQPTSEPSSEILQLKIDHLIAYAAALIDTWAENNTKQLVDPDEHSATDTGIQSQLDLAKKCEQEYKELYDILLLNQQSLKQEQHVGTPKTIEKIKLLTSPSKHTPTPTTFTLNTDEDIIDTQDPQFLTEFLANWRPPQIEKTNYLWNSDHIHERRLSRYVDYLIDEHTKAISNQNDQDNQHGDALKKLQELLKQPLETLNFGTLWNSIEHSEKMLARGNDKQRRLLEENKAKILNQLNVRQLRSGTSVVTPPKKSNPRSNRLGVQYLTTKNTEPFDQQPQTATHRLMQPRRKNKGANNSRS